MLILYKYIFKSNNFSFKKKKEIIKLLLLHKRYKHNVRGLPLS